MLGQLPVKLHLSAQARAQAPLSIPSLLIAFLACASLPAAALDVIISLILVSLLVPAATPRLHIPTAQAMSRPATPKLNVSALEQALSTAVRSGLAMPIERGTLVPLIVARCAAAQVTPRPAVLQAYTTFRDARFLLIAPPSAQLIRGVPAFVVLLHVSP